MSAIDRCYTSDRIAEYLTQKVREAFPEDFKLIEKDLPGLIERYSLKELIIIIRVEINRIKQRGPWRDMV